MKLEATVHAAGARLARKFHTLDNHGYKGWVGIWAMMAVVVMFVVLALLVIMTAELGAAELGYFDANTIERRMSANRTWVARLLHRQEGLRKAGLVEGSQDAPYQRIQKSLRELDQEYAELDARLKQVSQAEPLWHGKNPADLTGKEWAESNEREKEVAVFVLIGAIEKEGKTVRNPTGFYVAKTDEIIAAEPSFGSKPLKQILLYAVHENE